VIGCCWCLPLLSGVSTEGSRAGLVVGCSVELWRLLATPSVLDALPAAVQTVRCCCFTLLCFFNCCCCCSSALLEPPTFTLPAAPADQTACTYISKCNLEYTFPRDILCDFTASHQLTHSFVENTKPIILQGVRKIHVFVFCWRFPSREEHRLRVFENRVLRKIFRPKRDEVTGDWRKLLNEELHNLYSSKLRGLSLQANYTDRATAACRRS
jgi:hypothetical protein